MALEIKSDQDKDPDPDPDLDLIWMVYNYYIFI